ncbi:hypothetical protein BVRB_9g219880 [Beta vulgaris subsp. vulgaris]|nr:hypothetical protein BVRB_9g219880 [Beta vulgaris subsp. vulgaris]
MADFSTQSGNDQYQIAVEELNFANTYMSNSPIFATRDNVAKNSMYRTGLCRDFWFKGKCNYGDTCIYAHRLEDLSNSRIMNKNSTIRKMCKYFWGDCPYGVNCIFMHKPLETYEGRQRDLSRETSVVSNFPPVGVASRIKTRPCHSWMRNKSCRYGPNCRYAHGEAELRRSAPVLASKSGNAWIAPPMALVKHISLKETRKPTAAEQKLSPRVCLFKWKKNKKIVGIYADWIDEESLMPWLASES